MVLFFPLAQQGARAYRLFIFTYMNETYGELNDTDDADNDTDLKK